MNAERELESVVVVVRSVLTGMGIEWFGMVWYGLVWYCMWCCIVCLCVTLSKSYLIAPDIVHQYHVLRSI